MERKIKKEILDMIELNKSISSLTFSESLKFIIKVKNKTIKEISLDSSLSIATINRYINNQRKPTKKAFIGLCKALEIEIPTIIRLMIKAGITYIPNENEEEIYFYLLMNNKYLRTTSIKNVLKIL